MYIVTGGAGFIGSAVVAGMNNLGIDNILVVDELGQDEKWKNLRGLRFADYVEKNVFRQSIAEKKLDGAIDAIVHLGACSSTTETDASFLVDNNFEFSTELAAFAISREIRFIYASSAATYGDVTGGLDDEDELVRLRPMNMYGYSKHMFDCWAHHNGYFNLIVGLKYTNVFGPNEYHKGDMRSMVNKAFHQINENGKVKLFKSHKPKYKHGEQKRDFLYIKDAVDMTLFFLEGYDGGIFNIGAGKAETWNTLVGAVFKAMGKKENIEYIDMPESIRGQYQYFTEADIRKLRGVGYEKPITPLKRGVEDYVKNYLLKDAYLEANDLGRP